MSSRDDAIVLHVRSYGEADAVVSLFARASGRVSLFAKGARASKRKETLYMPLYEVSLELHRRPASELLSGRTVNLVRSHTRISADLTRLAAGNVVLELLREMFRDGERDARMYDIAVHTLEQLESADPLITVLAFEHALLAALGVGEDSRAFEAHTLAFERLRGKALPAREFFKSVL